MSYCRSCGAPIKWIRTKNGKPHPVDPAKHYIIKGEGKEKEYDRCHVVTGLSDGVNIEIKKGLTDKDKVRGPEIIADDDKK